MSTPANPHTEQHIDATATWLASPAALRLLDADGYWPKWHGPWWQIRLLYELGHAERIPAAAVSGLVAALDRLPLKHFPIHPEDTPPGTDPFRGSPCHCQLGDVMPVLAACGVDVDAALPWVRPWFLRYQMADGGLTCDNDAYLVAGECPSSMVGTIAPFEAVLLATPRAFAEAEVRFLDGAAAFLRDRELRLGSSTVHNASERDSARDWGRLCFPRFYFYDVLRGLSALVRWAEVRERRLPWARVAVVVTALQAAHATGEVSLGRRPWEGARTVLQSPDGTWQRRQPSQTTPLLEAVSQVGARSPALTAEWQRVSARLDAVLEPGRDDPGR